VLYGCHAPEVFKPHKTKQIGLAKLFASFRYTGRSLKEISWRQLLRS
jgi:hypothetical protein